MRLEGRGFLGDVDISITSETNERDKMSGSGKGPLSLFWEFT